MTEAPPPPHDGDRPEPAPGRRHRAALWGAGAGLLVIATAAVFLLRPGGPVEEAREGRSPQAPRPDASLLSAPGVRAAGRSVVRVIGTAPSCKKRIEGTGFVYAPERVLTVAHVVAGVTEPDVVGPAGSRTRAEVVYYDPAKDVAVLRVPGLTAAALAFGPRGRSGDQAIVAGYPGNTSVLSLLPAWIRTRQPAVGPDIYQSGSTHRTIYTFGSLRSPAPGAATAKARGSGLVEPGDSGGPLLRADGSVYGMIFAAARDDADLGYALTAEELRTAESAGRTATEPVGTQGCAL